MEPYPTNWRAVASETRGASEAFGSRGSVPGVRGLSPTPALDAMLSESYRRSAVAMGDTRARRVTKAQLAELERQREKHAIRRGGWRHHTPHIPQSMLPLAKGALSGVRFPMRHPVLNMMKMALNLAELLTVDDGGLFAATFMGYSLSNVCTPRLSGYLGNEIMADLTSGASCLVLQVIAENPLPYLPASAPDVGFSTYVQGPFGRWATLATYDPVVVGEAPSLAAGPMSVAEFQPGVHPMLDALSSNGVPAVRPLPLALNAAVSGHNPMRAPSEQNERGYGEPRPRTQADPGPAARWREQFSGDRGSVQWDKTGRVGFSKKRAFPRPYRRDVKPLRVERALVSLVGQATELLDHVDALYDALPESIKKKLSARFGSQKKAVSTKAKIFALLTNWDKVDLGQASYNMLYNAVFDRLQAQASKRGAKLSREHGGPARQLTPSRAAPQDTEGPHGSVSSAVKAILKESGFSAPSTQDYLQALGWASAQRRAVVPRER